MVRRVVGLGVGALLLSSCIVGETEGARIVSNTSATLEGRLRTTESQKIEQATYWFEYGLTTDYGQSTPRTTDFVWAGDGTEVSQEVAGLEPGTTYHFRLCGRSSADQGTCGADKTVTTGVARGSVRGGASSYDPGSFPPYTERRDDVSIKVAGDLDGGPYLEGTVGMSGYFHGPPPHFGLYNYGAEYPVHCLRIEGNRASVTFYLYEPDFGVYGYENIMIEDNGPTGDRMSMQSLESPTCPEPTAPAAIGSWDFVDFVIEGG